MGQEQSGMICTRGGGSPVGPKHCPPGKVMTGVAWRHGAAVDRIRGIWCKDVHKMDETDNDNNTEYYVLNWGGKGGKDSQSRCPKGTAIKGVEVSLGSNYVGGVELRCAPFLPKQASQGSWAAATKLPMIGSKYPNKNKVYPAGGSDQAIGTFNPNGWYLTGVEGRSGEMLDCVGWYSSNFGKYHDLKWDEKAQVDCCSGKNTDTVLCGKYSPGSADCSNVMKSYCTKNDNIALDECQNFCRNNQGIECDTAMIDYCKRQKQAGKSPELCNCINSESLAPQCWDPMCSQTAAYQTLNQLSRQDCGVFCNQEINVAETQGDVGIDRAQFEQKCGSKALKELEDAINPTPADDPDTAELEKKLKEQNPDISEEEIKAAKDELRAKKESTSNYWLIIIVAVLVLVVIGGAGVIFAFLRRRRNV